MDETGGLLQCLSAVTVQTPDMARAVAFYRSLGFAVRYGGVQADFTSFVVGPNYLNLMRGAGSRPAQGRIIFHVSDVDAMYARALAAGWQPDTRPADAPWGERYFHLSDPDGHRLSFARSLGE